MSRKVLIFFFNQIIVQKMFLFDHRNNFRDELARLDNTPLPLERHPKLLGVTFSPLLTFHQHTKILKEQTTDRLKFLKALTGTNWGQQKETIIMTCKALIWSKLTYAAPV